MLDLLVKTNDVHFKLRSLMQNLNILALCVLLNSVLIFAISVKNVVAFYWFMLIVYRVRNVAVYNV